jgi:hypothetical protein
VSDEKILTNEIAELFLADQRSVELKEFEHIEDSAAESLSKHKNWLYLSGLTSLSDSAAESLSKYEGYLSLDGLTSLSDSAAESLSKHKGSLYLSGLTSLSDSAAESLSKHKGDLYLFGLTSLSDSAAESLSKHKGDLYLFGLTSLSDSPGHLALAESLSKHEGRLYLNGLRSLTDTAAKSLSGWCDKQGSFCWRQISDIVLMQIRHEPCCWYFGGEYNTDLIFAINLSCFSESEPVFGFHSDEHNARDLALDGLEIIDEQRIVADFNEHAFVVMRALRNRIDENIARITVDGGGEYNVEILHLPSEGSPKEILGESFCCK